MAYDPVGAMGGLFAPAYIHGNPESEAATAKWQAENFAVTPEMIEASRGPGKTIATSPVANAGIRGNMGGGTMTVPGSVDPVALQIYAQGGKYTPKAAATPLTAAPAASLNPAANAQRDAITGQILGAGRTPNATAGSLIAPRTGAVMPGYQQAYSPLAGLMGEGDNTGFMQGSWAGGA